VTKRYHHGDLRRELIRHALAEITDNGVAALSLRELARRAGVTHGAPAHHFRDKTGLLTAIAIEGFTLLADTLETARERGSTTAIPISPRPATGPAPSSTKGWRIFPSRPRNPTAATPPSRHGRSCTASRPCG
jgi:AcrR family transcriptional regulator